MSATQPGNQIFVFGSNLAGRHGKGAALFAKQRYGAICGKGFGPQGLSYAIPTKDVELIVLPLSAIKIYADEFIRYASIVKNEIFFVTRIGCGLAGYKDAEIAPLFHLAPNNCITPSEWKPWLPNLRVHVA